MRAAPGAALETLAECKLLLLQSVTKVWLQPPKLIGRKIIRGFTGFTSHWNNPTDFSHLTRRSGAKIRSQA